MLKLFKLKKYFKTIGKISHAFRNSFLKKWDVVKQQIAEWLTEWRQKIPKWRGVIFSFVFIVFLVIALRFLGWLQPLELMALDWYFQLRPAETIEDKIVIVGVTESDYRRLQPYYPMTDKVLAQVLEKIKKQQPRVIGLDLYRDVPVNPQRDEGTEKLTQIFKNTDNLIGIEKAIGTNTDENDINYNPPVPPPPALLEAGRVGANDVVIDSDGFLRRALLSAYVSENNKIPSLGLLVASMYLSQEGIDFVPREDGLMQLGNTAFLPFEANDGGYVRADNAGYQIIQNYINPPSQFKSVSLFEVLNDRIESNLFSDKIVLIGAKAPSLNDLFRVPYSRELFKNSQRVYGVEVQANIIYQILSAAQGKRPLIKFLPEKIELLWILTWTTFASLSIWQIGTSKKNRTLWHQWKKFPFYRNSSALLFALTVTLLSVTFLAFYLLAWWLPVVPSFLGIFGAFILTTRAVYVDVILQYNEQLYKEVKARTKDLEIKTEELEIKNRKLEEAIAIRNKREKQLIAQHKLVTLGTLIEGICHELNNSINVIDNYVEGITDFSTELKVKTEQLFSEKRITEQWLTEMTNLLPKSMLEEKELLNRSHARQLKLEQEINWLLKETLHEYVPILNKHSHLMVSIFRNLMFHGLGSAKRKEYLGKEDLELSDINKIIAEAAILVIKTLERSSQKQNLSVKIEGSFDSNIPLFYLSATDVTQVLVNLIKNGVDAVKNQQVKLSSSEYIPRVLITTKNEPGLVKITVSDNGEGIPKENQDKVFQDFFTTKGKYGTGLGLTIVRDLVENKNHGKVYFESSIDRVNKGTKFIVLWPIIERLSN